MKKSVKMIIVAIAVLTVLALCVWQAVFAEERNGVLTVSFLDVGQGDAIFIDAPSGRQVLIDGGPNRSVLRELAEVSPWYDRSIDVVIATHPDNDHIGGLVDVLARYGVSHIVQSSVKDEEGTDSHALEAAIVREVGGGAQRMIAVRGQIIDLGDGAYIEVLFPDRDVSHIETNTGSVALRLVYGDTAFMLTGDAPRSIEEYLVQLDGEALKSNVLKAGHHGSRTSSSLLFVGFVSPEYAVLSRGCDNSYGHPHEEVTALFSRFGVMTKDTCLEGRVSFVSDGQTVRLK